MSESNMLAPNFPNVASETLDGETIIINLENGCYFSLKQTAVEIWTLIEAGATSTEIVQALKERYPEAAELEQEVQSFLELLKKESLLVERAQSSKERAAKPTYNPVQAAYSTPVFAKYTDMQDLLLLDPIHEVDDSGWPNAQA